MNQKKYECPAYPRCGGCTYLDLTYEEQLTKKQEYVDQLYQDLRLASAPIVRSKELNYRCKVQMSFVNQGSRHLICGNFEAGSHRIIPVASCLLDHPLADEIIGSVKQLSEKFHLPAYDEKKKTGVIRHVMVRIGLYTSEVMVILVTGTSYFPGKQNFVKELRKKHPQITTVVQNINGAYTSKVLGDKFQTIYGPGFIYDELMGKRFRLSPGAFYQINPPQAERLYEKAIELAGLSKDETLLDAYCGTGTIGILAASKCRKVVGVELNKDAVSDARINARINQIQNISFVCGDAGKYLLENDFHPDVVLMDPPRSGSSEAFLGALIQASPDRIVYISCGPDTQVRDIKYLMKAGYQPVKLFSYDLFPWTEHVESCVLLERVSNRKADSYVKLNVKMEDYYRIKDAEKKADE
ncbi:MAG: 23S rRNA (uracil(1939)-C(5))-methyltransferase RlmD [Firmicutes bacterium]|nr:23S rRNA (uracil(1939)-C(5))-methyltransferase RlmD [Bacillota bacterium]